MNENGTEFLKSRLHLAETKLRNIQDNLKSKGRLREALRHHQETARELEKRTARMTDLKREEASLADRYAAMERFENFESMQYPLLSLQTLEEQNALHELHAAEVQQKLDDILPSLAETDKRLGLAMKAMETRRMTVHESREMLTLSCRIEGREEILQTEMQHMEQLLQLLEEMDGQLKMSVAENDQQLQGYATRIEENRQKAQYLAPHQAMLEKTEAIVLRIKYMTERAERKKRLQQEYEKALMEHEQEQEVLGDIYRQYQDIEGEIQSLQDQVGVYRYNIAGKDSYSLQDRAFSLRERHSALISALSLWQRICTGYRTIEEIQQRITALAQDVSRHEGNISQLEREVSTSRNMAEEKLYAWNMSKAQDIVTMRGELREGVACPVCGAAHHPLHSESLLEQTHLISTLRKEYEAMDAELKAEENLLKQERVALLSAQVEKTTLEEVLTPILQRQREDEAEWQTFAHLDASFVECNQFVDQASRTTLLGQFIDSAKKSVELANRELDDYNENQNLITQVTEKIATLTNRKDEIMARFGEVNTSIQVHAGDAERIKARQQHVDRGYQTEFDELSKVVSLVDWYTTFVNNPDALQQQLLQMEKDWKNIEEERIELTHRHEMAEEMAAVLKERLVSVEQMRGQVRDVLSDIQQRSRHCIQERENITPTHIPAQMYHEQTLQAYMESQNEVSEYKETSHAQHDAVRALEGQQALLKEYIQDTAQRISGLNGDIDHWIHVYNASNQPVQVAEMRKVLTMDFDWNKERRYLMGLRTDILVEQQRIDILQSRMAALEAETGTVMPGQEQTMIASLIPEQNDLEHRLQEIIIEVAQLRLSLDGQQGNL